MSVAITRTQQKTEGAFNSNTVGYLNPVWWGFQQTTNTFNVITDLGGGLIRIDDSTGMTIGDKIKIATPPANIYSGIEVGTVTAVGAGTIDVSGIVYKGNFSGIMVNLTKFKNLHIETRLVDYTNAVISKAVSTWFTSPNMNGIIDLQSELLSLAYKREVVDYSLVMYSNISDLKFKMQYREVYWDVNSVKQVGAFVDAAGLCLGVPARKQIREIYGNNLLDYVLRPSGALGKVLVRFGVPMLWRNGTQTIPRPVSFVIDNSGIANVTSRIVWQNANHVSIGVASDILPITEAGLYTYFIKNAPVNAFFAAIHFENGAGAPVSQTKVYAVRNICTPAVMLEWENSLGGLEQWVFMRKQTVSFESAGGAKVPYEFYEPDIENSNGNLGKDGSDSYFEMELIDEYVQTLEIPWLHELKTSKQVRCIFPNGVAIFCIILEAATPARTDSTYATYSVRVRMPRNFSPSLIDGTLLKGQIDPYLQLTS